MKIGFDNDKYLKMQSEHIRERIGKFGGNPGAAQQSAFSLEKANVPGSPGGKLVGSFMSTQIIKVYTHAPFSGIRRNFTIQEGR